MQINAGKLLAAILVESGAKIEEDLRGPTLSLGDGRCQPFATFDESEHGIKHRILRLDALCLQHHGLGALFVTGFPIGLCQRLNGPHVSVVGPLSASLVGKCFFQPRNTFCRFSPLKGDQTAVVLDEQVKPGRSGETIGGRQSLLDLPFPNLRPGEHEACHQPVDCAAPVVLELSLGACPAFAAHVIDRQDDARNFRSCIDFAELTPQFHRFLKIAIGHEGLERPLFDVDVFRVEQYGLAVERCGALKVSVGPGNPRSQIVPRQRLAGKQFRFVAVFRERTTSYCKNCKSGCEQGAEQRSNNSHGIKLSGTARIGGRAKGLFFPTMAAFSGTNKVTA